jgi:CHASE2 domain-containing sensor protein
MSYKVYWKYLFKRDTVLATISIFLVIELLGLIPLNPKILNPIKTALKDFQFNDLAYAKLGKNNYTKSDDRIVIVNVGWLDRQQIGYLISQIDAARPSAIGLDVQFSEPRDPSSDSFLSNVLLKTQNLVSASKLVWQGDTVEQKGYFYNSSSIYGYVNFIGEEKSTIRSFSPFEKHNGKLINSFSAALVKTVNPKAYQKLFSRNREVETLHYRRRSNKFFILNGDDVIRSQMNKNVFRDKIVLIGYINKARYDIEDKHFTPMNQQFAGRSLPDMNGVLIHANIISMILDRNYISKMPGWLTWIITILLAWIHVVVFIRYFIEKHMWFHFVAKLAQIASAIFFIYLSILLFHFFSYIIDIKMPIIVIVLAVDVIYFYEAIALWLHKKWGYNTIFNSKH